MEIRNWLTELGLEQYATAFEENAIDGSVLPLLTIDDLKEIGVEAVGHRRRLLDAIAKLTPVAAAPDPSVMDEAVGERRQVSVLFADLAGFTKLSIELDAEDVRNILEAFFHCADRAVIDHGGTVDKHIGDSVMGVFGAPVAYGNDAERAVRAALAVRDGVTKLATRLGRSLEVHIGIASGQVVAAPGGTAKREYTVTGESVNLASRLADHAIPGQILISKQLHGVIADRFDCTLAGQFALKGFVEPLEAWSVLQPKQTRPEPAHPFVGRRAELNQLTAAMDNCSGTAKGQAILVRGEPGIGKSRLVEAFETHAREAGYAVHHGMVLDFGGHSGRSAVSDLLHGLMGGASARNCTDNVGVFRNVLSSIGLDVGQQAIVFDLLDVSMPDAVGSVFAAMDHAARERSAKAALKKVVGWVSQRTPLLLIIEDAHWAGPAVLNAIVAIAEVAVSCKVLLVVTSRFEGGAEEFLRGTARSLLILDLAPLDPDEALALARGYFGQDGSQAQACVRRAAGNPLFLEQLFQHARSKASDAVPDTVQSLVQARLDQLSSRDKQALQSASVLGQSFPIEAVCHLMDDTNFDCSELIRGGLLHQNDADIGFSHALIRDAVYGSLLRTHRNELHARAGAWLEAADPVLAAEHWVIAEDSRAPAACLRAATGLIGRFRYEPALGLLKRGLALSHDQTEQVAMLLLRGEALLQSGAPRDAEAVFARALKAQLEPSAQCIALLGRASARRITDDIELALADVDQALEIAQANGLTDTAARAFGLRGNLLFPKGDGAGCLTAHAESLTLARKAGSVDLEATALGGLGDAEYMRGRLGTAHDYFRDCVATSSANGLRRIEAVNLPMLAITRFWKGDILTAYEDACTAIESATRIGNERALMIAHHAAYFCTRQRLMVDEAMQHAEAGLQLARRLRAPRFEAEGLAFCAQLLADRGDRIEARELFSQSVAIARASGMAYMGPILLGGYAQVAPNRNAQAEAIAEAEALLAAGSLCHNHLIFRRDMIDLCLKHKDWSGAKHHAQAMADYCSAEPLATVRFLVARARGIARHGEGKPNVRGELERLVDEADELGDLHARIAILAVL